MRHAERREVEYVRSLPRPGFHSRSQRRNDHPRLRLGWHQSNEHSRSRRRRGETGRRQLASRTREIFPGPRMRWSLPYVQKRTVSGNLLDLVFRLLERIASSVQRIHTQGRLTPLLSGVAHGVLVARHLPAGPERWARSLPMSRITALRPAPSSVAWQALQRAASIWGCRPAIELIVAPEGRHCITDGHPGVTPGWPF